MTFQAAVAHELPFLRRYARTLTGSQSVGDAAVRETLQAMIAAPEEFNAEADVRQELYRIFHKIWTDSSLRPMDTPGAIVGSLPRRLRKALLLTTIEGFSEHEAAYILEIEENDVHDFVVQAREAIHSMLSAKVMIIEDEAIIALHLKSLLMSMGNDVGAIVRTKDEAVATAADLQPELILADVNLADGSSGIDAVAEILQEMTIPVIFITAFPEKLLTGERDEPAYVISKPFNPDDVVATVWQALLVARETAAMSECA
ncbi:MAG: response regulator [Sphingomonadales bacterium]|nr:response regulator [Sphingomonadales bacterium]NCQ22689.1 response regulator [Sphingomonadales bacterium]NCT04885.1 response regulator [Sphingomonadales bacterium]